ncbi:MFS transporter [Methyloligella sp. GL2]|nr:MFS transporter [Methyloligella sp. GL2]
MFAVAFAFFVVMPGTTLPTPLYPIYREAFGLSELTITVIFAIYAIGVMTVLVVAGGWSDLIGRRPMLFAGIAAAIVGTIILASAQGLWGLLIGRVVVGFSAGVFTGTATVTIVELAPERWRGHAPLLATASNMLGLGSGPLLAGILAEYAPYPLRLSYIVELGLLGLALLCIWAIPETRPREPGVRLHMQKPMIVPEVRPVFIPAAIACFAGFSVLGVFGAAAPALLHEVFGFSNHVAFGGIMFLLFFCSTMGQVLQSKIAPNYRFPLGCIVLALGAAMIGVAIQLESLTLLVAGAIVNGTGHGVVFRAGIQGLTEVTPPYCRAETMSAFFIIAYIAICIPIVGFGASIAPLGLALSGEVFSGLAALLAIVALVLLPREGGMSGEMGRSEEKRG